MVFGIVYLMDLNGLKLLTAGFYFVGDLIAFGFGIVQ